MPRRIVALTPNPAIDRTLTLDRPLRPGHLHRVRHVREAAGGKGVNLVRAVVALGGEAVATGPLAGLNGRTFRELLAREGLPGAMSEVREGETRQCSIVLDGGDHPTEINEPGPRVGEAQWRALLAALPPGRIAVSGSLPPGTEAERFGPLLAGLPGPLAVDMHGPALAAALEAGAELIAPNRRELRELAERLGLPPVGEELASVRDAAEAVRRRYGARVLVTLGDEGAAYLGERAWLARAPEVAAVNPIASGDCLLGAFLWAEEGGLDAAEALALGVAAGADNARRGGGAAIDGASVRALARRVAVSAWG